MSRHPRILALSMLVGGLILGVILTYWIGGAKTAPSRETFSHGLVERVVDGDTVILSSGERLRYIGIDTPEQFGTPECGARQATALNRELVQGRAVELLPGPEERDQYGRLLRYVFAEGVFVNAELVREGMARARMFHSDERFGQVLLQLEVGARAAGRGLWNDCEWTH